MYDGDNYILKLYRRIKIVCIQTSGWAARPVYHWAMCLLDEVSGISTECYSKVIFVLCISLLPEGGYK
jgi:hypothetical protein